MDYSSLTVQSNKQTNKKACNKELLQIFVAMKLFMSKNFFTVQIKSSWGGEKNEWVNVFWPWFKFFRSRTMDAQWSLFSLKSRTFGLGQTNWADKFWGIWGIFGQTISTHFGTVSPLSMFSIIQPLFLQKTKPLYPHPKYLFGIGIWIWIWAAKI